MKFSHLFIFLIILFFLPLKILASETNYFIKTKLNTEFSVSGESASRLQLTIRNLTSNNFPVSLKVNIHGDKIKIISAKDDYGDLTYVYTYQPSGINTIDVKFNRRMVGKNVITHLNLSYTGQNAQRSENTWVVFYPKIDLGSPGDFIYNVTVPDSFGRLIAAQTLPSISLNQDNTTTYSLAGNSLELSSRLIFGSSFPHSFILSYPPSQQIILPKDTASQKIYLTNLNPVPDTLELQDGYWIAAYPKNVSGISVSGYAVFLSPDTDLDIPKISSYTPPEKIEINPHPYQYLPAKPVSISIKPPTYYWPFISNKILLEIRNPNSQALYNNSLTLESSGLEIITEKNPIIQAIPPTGDVLLPLNVILNPAHLFAPKHINISVSDISFSYNLSRKSLFIYYIFSYVVVSLIIIITLYFAIFTWRLYIQRFRK